MAYEVQIKGMVPIAKLRDQFPALEPVLKKIPEDAWAAVDDKGNLIIGLMVFTTAGIPISELQAFKQEDQEQWSSLCMRSLLIQLEKETDAKMLTLTGSSEPLIKVIPLRHYG